MILFELATLLWRIAINMQNYVNMIIQFEVDIRSTVNIPIDINIVISPSSKYKCIYHKKYCIVETIMGGGHGP